MKDLEVLKKAIEVAMENGWKPSVNVKTLGIDEPISALDYALNKRDRDLILGNFLVHPQLLFFHGFAKAFWGDITITPLEEMKDCPKGIALDVGEFKSQSEIEEFLKEWKKTSKERGDLIFTKNSSFKSWEYHLQQMVLEENPIDYLIKFIDE